MVFNQAIDSALSGNSPRRQPETPATVEKWDMAKSLAFYKARFADASNFTFVFVGSFTPESIKPLVETYIASLPATRAKETWRDLGIVPPTGVVERTIQKGIAPEEPGRAGLLRTVPLRRAASAGVSRHDADAAVAAVRHDPTGARRHLQHRGLARGAQGAEAGILRADRLDLRTRRRPRRSCSGCSTRSSSCGARPISPDRWARIRDALRREFERNSEDNGYLLNQIARRYADGETADLASIVNLQDRIAALTGEEIQDAARTYLNTKSYVKVTLMPEGK